MKFQTYKAPRNAGSKELLPPAGPLPATHATSNTSCFASPTPSSQTDYAALAEHARAHGVELCSTPFDLWSVSRSLHWCRSSRLPPQTSPILPLFSTCAAHGNSVVLGVGASSIFGGRKGFCVVLTERLPHSGYVHFCTVS